MVYNTRFQICAILIVLMLFIIFFSKKMLQSFSDKVFISLLGSISVSIILDMASTILIIGYPIYSQNVYNTVCKMYLVSLVVSVLLIYLFIVIDVVGEKREVYRIMPLSILPVYFGICYICLQPVGYHAAGGNLFIEGTAAAIAYSICILYFIVIAVLLQSGKMRREIRQSAKMVVLLFLGMILLEVFHVNVRVESLAFALLAVYIYMNIKNADEHIDKAMGIFNQDAFEYYLKDLAEDGKPAFVLYIGFDDFKVINTTFGFENGKALFKNVVDKLQGVTEGKVFHIDAYELACVFAGGKSAYRNYRNTIRYRIKEDFMVLDAHVKLPAYILEIPVPVKQFDYGEVFAIMKQYMAEMVSSGRSYLLINNEHFVELRKQNHIRHVIEQAIANGKVEICYQPIYNMKDNVFDRAEALLRMYDEEGEQIPSDMLIAIADNTGLIMQLGDLIFKNIFSFSMEHDLLGAKLKKLHINLSGVQCASEGLVAELSEQMEKYHISPQYIDLEIREKAAHLNDDVFMNNLQSMTTFGSTFSLDDYGKGYANLESIMEWPIEHVKLDKDLVHIEQSNKKAEQALFFVVEMARQLGLQVVAKGVETEEDFIRMENFKVNYIQGFYLAKVLNEKDFLKFLEKPLIIKEV